METEQLPVKRIGLTILFVILLALCLTATLKLTARKDSEIKYGDFFDHASEIDVLFLGSSHVINGVNPAELFERYGITSYNMGGHGSILPATYWELMLSLDYCTPRVVVVDTYMLEKDYQYIDLMTENDTDDARQSSISQLHLNMDAFPLTDTKRAAITDLIHAPAIRRQFLYPELLYHSRWSALEATDYAALTGQDIRNPLLGCELRYGLEITRNVTPRPGIGAGMDAPTVGVSYLNRIIEECQARGIGVLLTCLPHNGTIDDQKAANGAALVAEAFGVPFLNYYAGSEAGGDFSDIDPYTDFHDPTHLNVTGTAKVTRDLGEALKAHFDLKDHRGENAYAFWQERTDAYAAARAAAQVNVTDLYQQLNQLHARFDASMNAGGEAEGGYVVFVRFHSEASSDSGLLHLIERLREHADLRGDLSGMWEDGQSYLLIRDRFLPAHAIEVFGTAQALSGMKTALGKVSYYPQDIFCLLSCDMTPEVNLLDMEAHYDSDVQILVYDGTGEILSHRCYTLLPREYASFSVQ